jgi:hypothetical protein
MFLLEFKRQDSCNNPKMGRWAKFVKWADGTVGGQWGGTVDGVTVHPDSGYYSSLILFTELGWANSVYCRAVLSTVLLTILFIVTPGVLWSALSPVLSTASLTLLFPCYPPAPAPSLA